MPAMVNSASFRNYLSSFLGRGPIKNLLAIPGGDINAAYQIEFNRGESLFLKTNAQQGSEFFRAEAEGLKALKQAGALYVPEIMGQSQFEGNSFLVLEFLELSRSGQAEALGAGLAHLHLHSNKDYGWERANYIGSLTQLNDWFGSWADFYAKRRILPMVERAFNAGLLNSADLKAVESFLYEYPHLVPTEKPALLHGDLWSGNVLYLRNGSPVLIDPAVYYGHREMDLAMMFLFGGFAPEVFSAYEAQFPLEAHWRDRLAYHQLYPLLVHLNLFGSSYYGACRDIWRPFSD